jgi:hypothetical protein
MQVCPIQVTLPSMPECKSGPFTCWVIGQKVLCLGIEPSFQVHCLPVLTNRLPEVVVGVGNFTYVPTLDIHPSTSLNIDLGRGFGTYNTSGGDQVPDLSELRI